MKNINEYKTIQRTAKEVLEEIKHFIVKGVREKDIATECVSLLRKKGVAQCWYHGVPALVLCGSNSKKSVSGRDYIASEDTVSNTDLVTIDLSPSKENIWGDCARSFAVENGVVVDQPKDTNFVSGFRTETKLHEALLNFARPDTTFCQLHKFANDLIIKMGFENLDFKKNLGHSIETDINRRKYIEIGNTAPLSSVDYFTFEPHIAALKSRWGFKYENIYYFDDNGIICEL